MPYIIFRDGLFNFFKFALFKDLSKKKIADIYSNSNAILDLSNIKQSGLSFRTIEALAAGKKIVTNNRNIIHYDFYRSEQIFIIESFSNINLKIFLNKKYNPINKTILEKYSLSDWVNTILFQKEHNFLNSSII